MKFSLIKNDKSTYKDEVVLTLLILVWLILGVVLLKYRPEFWFVDSSMTATLGVLLILLSVMFIPGLIYRLFHNEK